MLLEELQILGVAFVSLAEGIDATTPAGKLQMHILGAIAEFERSRIAERVQAVIDMKIEAVCESVLVAKESAVDLYRSIVAVDYGSKKQ